MINAFQFEWLKAKKSHMIFLILIFCLTVTVLFFGVQYFQQAELYEEQRALIEKEVIDLETEANELKQSVIRLENEDDSYPNREGTISNLQQIIDFNENMIPSAQSVLDAFESGDYKQFYNNRLTFIEEMSLINELDLYLVEGEAPIEGIDPYFQQEYEQLEAFYEADEPIEDEEVSLAYPNHLVLLSKFLLNPFILIIFLLLISLVFIEEVSEGSLRLELTETNHRFEWFSFNRLFSIILFILMLVFSLSLSRILLFLFGSSMFNVSPSWSAPLVLNGQVYGSLTLGRYFLLLLMIVIVSFILLHQLFSLLLVYIKQPIISIILFSTIGIFGYFFTQTFIGLQHWLNPFQLFFIDDLIRNNQQNDLFVGMGVSIIFSLVLFIITLNKLKRSPLK